MQAPKRYWSAMSISWPRSKPAAACSPNSVRICRGPNTFRRCGGCATPTNAPPPSRCATGGRPRCAAPRLVPHPRPAAHCGDQIAMAADALAAYRSDIGRRQRRAADLRHHRDGRCPQPAPPPRHHRPSNAPTVVAGARPSHRGRRPHPHPAQRRHHPLRNTGPIPRGEQQPSA